MLVRIRLAGDGTVGNPYRVNLPTYDMVAIDYSAGTAIVNVPDRDLPDDARLLAHLDLTRTLKDKPAPTMPSAYKAAWHRHLDRRYREHDGRFRPPLA